MQAEGPAFGGGATSSVIHPVILVATAIATVLMLILPRRRILIPFLLVAFLGSWGQFFYIAGVHLFVVRILILTGLVRLSFSRGPSDEPKFAGGWNRVDTVYLLWTIFHALADVVRHSGSSGVLIYESGFLWELVGGYVLFRVLIRNEEDTVAILKLFAVLTPILSLAMLNEKLRGQNIFGYLGSVSIMPEVREGSIRAQGSFVHPIVAGVAGATLVPLFWCLWKSRKAKWAGIVGFMGSTVMIFTSASATPLFAYLSAFLGLCFWPLRKKMRAICWGTVLALVSLHLVMKAPIWFLIARVDLIAGSSGYHRAMLIDQCVRHFSDWWLFGSDAMASWGWDMWDLSNQFVVEADIGGLATFVCFVLVISLTFGRIGRARKVVEGDAQQEWFLWFLGITLLTHVVSYFGITYQDQTKFSWCAFLAITSAATAPILARQAQPDEVSAPQPTSVKLTLEPPATANYRTK